MSLSMAGTQNRWSRGLAVGGALAALAAGLTMTDRALSAPGELTSTLEVSGTTGVISDVNLRTQIAHSFSHDLEIFLTSPEGTKVAISTRNPALGVDGVNVFQNATWDDQGDDPVTDKSDFVDNPGALSLIPEAALDAFAGEDPDGTWSLTVRDVDPVGSGTLTGWGLDVQTTAQPTTVPAMAAEDPEPNVDIPDNTAAGVERTLNVAGLGTSIWDVNLVTNINHPAGQDLTVLLTSPAGTTAVITSGNGFNKNVFNGVTFNDQAGLPTPRAVSDDPFDLPFPSSFVPEGAMAQFKGQNPNGTWTLKVIDGAPADEGTLDFWRLDFQTGTFGSTLKSVTSDDPPAAIPDADPPVDPNPQPQPQPNPGPGTPPAQTGGTPPPVVTPTKLAPRGLGLAVTRRDRRAPYVITASGKLLLPAGVQACAGKVRVVAKAGRRTVATRVVGLRRSGSACVYRATFRLGKRPASLPRSGKLTISARFLGAAGLKARASKPASAKLG